MKTLIITLLFVQMSAFSQEKVPTQSDLLKRGIVNFFLDLPGSMLNDALRFYGMDPYTNYVRMHRRNPKKSPWSVFSGIQERRIPTSEHSFTFVNADYDFDDISETEFGVCSAITFGLRRFNMLAHYDLKNKAGQRIPNKETNFAGWLKFYQSKIDRVLRLRPTVFPEFENLSELASVPEIRLYLRKNILALWVEKNVSVRGLIQLVSVKEKTTVRKNNLLFRQILTRLNRGYNPIIFMSQPRSTIAGPGDKRERSETTSAPYNMGFGEGLNNFDHWIHVVQVYKITPRRSDGSFDFFVWDINEELIEYVKKKVEVKANGDILWPDIESLEGFYKLSAAKLFPQDDREVGIILRNKAWWCHHNPKFKKYCYEK